MFIQNNKTFDTHRVLSSKTMYQNAISPNKTY